MCNGWIPEWPKGTDCKSAANCFGGSNPPPPIICYPVHVFVNRFFLVAWKRLFKVDNSQQKMVSGSGEKRPAHLAERDCREQEKRG